MLLKKNTIYWTHSIKLLFLDSAHSSVAMSPVPPEAQMSRSSSFTDDLGQDYVVVLRIKLSPQVSKDCWLTILTIENHLETIGIHINVQKGLKLTLANSIETIAAAETTFKSMLFPDQWIHLAFNLGTLAEGKRETKTLTAYVNCQKVWGVGLCVDKVQSKVRKKEITVTVGPLDNVPDASYSSLIISDIHILKNSIFSQENVVLNYICGPSDLNSLYAPDKICFQEIKKDLPDLVSHCTKIISDPKVLRQHLDFSKQVVAHFSPLSFWRREPNEDLRQESWTLLDGLLKAGGAECLVMGVLEGVERKSPPETLAKSLSFTLEALTANQTSFEEFMQIGGFDLFGSILSSKTYEPNVATYEALLHGSSPIIGLDRVLFFPELLDVCLQHVERFRRELRATVLQNTVQYLAQLLSDSNQAAEFNSKMMEKFSIFDSLLICLQTFGEINDECLPVEGIANLLSALPASPDFLVKLLNLVLSTLPPYLLYLPYLSRSLLHVTMVKEKRNPDLINKVHSSDVVDISSALPPENILKRISEETAILSKSKQDLMDTEVVNMPVEEIDLEFYETEEDKVSDWEVLTREHSPRPATPNSYIEEKERAGNLAALIVDKILSGFTILSDSESSALTDADFKPENILPLVRYPSPDVHSPSLDLMGLILERSTEERRHAFQDSGGYHQLAAMIQESSPSVQLISSVLSILHGHPVDVNVPFEFNKLSPPQLNYSAVCLLPPLIVSSLNFLSLGHNLLCHVHELLANLPEFTEALMAEHLLQSLVAGLIKLGDLPETESDIFGCNESELLTEDIYNILR